VSWLGPSPGWRGALQILAGGAREELGHALEAAGRALVATGRAIAYRGRVERAWSEAWAEAERLRRVAEQRKDWS